MAPPPRAEERGDSGGGGSPPPARPGVGLAHIASLPDWLYNGGLIDFVELTPETLCREVEGPGGRGRRRFALQDRLLEAAQRRCRGLPLAVHGVELSIGSAHGVNEAYLDLLRALRTRWPFAWHSEHLHFQTLPAAAQGGPPVEIGVPLPLPATEEAAALVAARARAMEAEFGVPFLLENPASTVEVPADGGMRDGQDLLNRVSALSGCGQLLDLHNLHCDALNGGFDALATLDRVDFARVEEIHVAGGAWDGPVYADAHSGAVPEAVWELLDASLPRAPRLRGVVFELLEVHAASFGAERIARELERARACVARRAAAAPATGLERAS